MLKRILLSVALTAGFGDGMPGLPWGNGMSFFVQIRQMLFLFGMLFLGLCAYGSSDALGGCRRILALNGLWQIAEGKMDGVPAAFDHTVPVPGLVSLAQPAFIEPGPKVADRPSLPQKDPRRDAFWYRRTFHLDGLVPAVATLKIQKAMFGTRVILNGQPLGDHLPCFTPGYFDATKALKTGDNELFIRVGADRDSVGGPIPSDFDFEKERYIPGIFDTVELILSGSPHIVNVQAAPDIQAKQVRVQARLRNPGTSAVRFTMRFTVRETKSGRTAGALEVKPDYLAGGTEKVLDVVIPIARCQLWSPETPFLYTLEVEDGADSCTNRFGMRDFRFDPASGRALLNGKAYFMRGSNISLYRFFEDSECRALPWDEKWVHLLFQRIKDMHWNCLRNCIGFPPEEWYRIADEEGILVQDEFPLWFGHAGWSKWPKESKRDELATEFTEWMEERWNHPCVVIWDASNETSGTETGPAIRQVRALDLSGRPWDNSYTYPQEPGDSFEVHPYHFQKAGCLSLAFWAEQAIGGQKTQLSVMLINDLDQPWDGPVTLRVKQHNRVLVSLKHAGHMDALGKTTLNFDLIWPELAGSCILEAELPGQHGDLVRSTRELQIMPATN
jgi:hypothetical protein